MYVIWCVSTVVLFLSSPLNLKIAAPRILIPLLLAACILRDTDMRPCNVILIVFFIMLNAAIDHGFCVVDVVVAVRTLL